MGWPTWQDDLVVGVDQFRVRVEAIDMAGRSVELSCKMIVEELSL